MNVLFQNIPIGMTDNELADYIETTFNMSVVDKSGLILRVGGIEMLEREDNFTHPIEKFGVVRITPPELAKSVIIHFDGKVINQLQISVREYFNRSEENDRRSTLINSSFYFHEQREIDRRKQNLIYSRQI